MVDVVLESWEYEYASCVGIRRFTANWEKLNAAHYKAERMEDDRTAQVAAAICELAVAKHANRYWHAHIWHRSEHARFRDLPDVGKNIEVRRVRTSNKAAVRRHQLGRGLVLWVAEAVAPEFRVVTLHGWIEHDRAWELGDPSTYDPENTKVIAAGKLYHPNYRPDKSNRK